MYHGMSIDSDEFKTHIFVIDSTHNKCGKCTTCNEKQDSEVGTPSQGKMSSGNHIMMYDTQNMW